MPCVVPRLPLSQRALRNLAAPSLLVALPLMALLTSAPLLAQAPSDPRSRTGELDPSVRGGAPYGSREAMRRTETEAMRRMSSDAADSTLPVAFMLFAGVGGVMPSSYASGLNAHGFGASSPNVTVDALLTYRLSENFFFGGQFGARGHGWLRRDGIGSMATGVDAMAVLHLRFQLGSVVDLGAIAGIGAGVIGVQAYDASRLAPALRVAGSVLLGVRAARGFRIFLRGTWDYFNATDVDRFGSDVDMGGPSISLGIEVRS